MAFFRFVIRTRECCYSMKFDLLTDATVVDDAIMFVVEKSKENLKSFSSSRNDFHLCLLVNRLWKILDNLHSFLSGKCFQGFWFTHFQLTQL
jgi:hypothetical protein